MLLFAGSAGADVVDRVVAKVNDEIVTLSLVRERAEILLGRMQAARATSVPSDKELLKEALDQIIDERLQLQDGRRNNIGVDDQSVQRAFDDIKKRNNVSQEDMVRMLESEGRTLDQYLETIREQILLSKVVRFQMGDPGNVSEKAVHAYYQNHLADYWVPPTPHVSHILFIMD
jgi:peptidyl-prolyl cis-trans isomerase SurA